MPKSEDPFYTRQAIPDEYIEHVGETGISKQEELINRERKFSATGQDIRKFDTKKSSGWHPQSDPFYSRKPVPDTLIHGVGETGLSAEEEFENRERKYSVTGVDVRRFDTKPGSGFHPSNDPYYARKSIPKTGIEGIGETGMSRAEEFQYREDKARLFQDSGDPFAIVAGTGHRGSVSAATGPGALETAAIARRRSSAVAPDHSHAAAAATHSHGHHSGYGNHGETLAPIESRQDDTVRPSNELPSTTTTTTTTTTTQTSTGIHGPTTTNNYNTAPNGGHTHFYEEATKDLDSVGPHDRV